MVAMRSLKNANVKEQLNTEICGLRKSFKALTADHKKGILKTAKGLLRIQRSHKKMTKVSGRSAFSEQYK